MMGSCTEIQSTALTSKGLLTLIWRNFQLKVSKKDSDSCSTGHYLSTALGSSEVIRIRMVALVPIFELTQVCSGSFGMF